MEVRCERCRAQYVFADDQVTEQGLTVRCSNCGHLFKVKKKALVVTLPVSADEAGGQAVSAAETARAAAVQAAAQAVMADAERRDFTLRQPSGQTYAFRDMSTLHRWIVERKAHREDEIRRADEAWRRLGTIPELQSFFAVVEAAERAALTPAPPASQPTMLQYPAQVFPGPGAPPPPTKTEEAFPPVGRGAPPPRTEVAFPPAKPPPATPRATATDLFATTPAPERPAAGEAAPPPDDPFRPRPGGTEQGLPPAPPPSAAPARPGASAAWEQRGGGKPSAPAAPPVPEPAWTRAQPAAPPSAPAFGRAARRGGSSAAWFSIAAVIAAGGAAAGWYFLVDRSRPPLAVPAPAPQAAAPVPQPTPPAPQAAAPAPQPTPPAPQAAAPAPQPAPPAPQAAAPAPRADAPATAAAPVPGTPAAPIPGTPAAQPVPRAPEPQAAAKADLPPAAPAGAAEPSPAEPAKAEPLPPARAEPAKPKGVKALLSQARRLRDQGKTRQALDLYGQAVGQAPGNAEAHAGRGWCYLELSQYAPAEAAFQAALEADSSSADGLLGLAETYRYEGRRADAVGYYERYLVEHPDGEDAVAAQNAIRSLKE